MAKITTGPLVAEIRNKLGAQVFSRNQYGAYTRAHAYPDNTPTPARLTTRARFAAANAAWTNDLTDPQRLAWMAYAAALTDHPGPVNGRPRTGRSAFLSARVNLDNIGAALISDPPNQPHAGDIRDLDLTIDADTATFELDGQIPPGAPPQGIIILATPPLPPSRYFGWNLARQITARSPGWTFPLDLWDDYAEIFDTPAAPNAVILYALPIAESSGLAGQMLSARTLAQGEGAPMLTKTTLLTDAQIKALPTTPATIVPGVPAKIIVPFLTTLQLDATAGAYTNLGTTTNDIIMCAGYTQRSNLVRNDLLLGTAAKRAADLSPRTQIDAKPPTSLDLYTAPFNPSEEIGTALILYCDNTPGNFTGGNAANSMKVTVYYQLLDPV